MEYPLVRYWQILTHYVRPLRVKVALLTILIFSGIALQVANPQIMRYFIDTALASEAGASLRPLYLAGALFLVIAFLLQIVTVAATYVGEDVGWRSTNQLRADLASHCLNLDMTFHNDQTLKTDVHREKLLSSFFPPLVKFH